MFFLPNFNSENIFIFTFFKKNPVLKKAVLENNSVKFNQKILIKNAFSPFFSQETEIKKKSVFFLPDRALKNCGF